MSAFVKYACNLKLALVAKAQSYLKLTSATVADRAVW